MSQRGHRMSQRGHRDAQVRMLDGRNMRGGDAVLRGRVNRAPEVDRVFRESRQAARER